MVTSNTPTAFQVWPHPKNNPGYGPDGNCYNGIIINALTSLTVNTATFTLSSSFLNVYVYAHNRTISRYYIFYPHTFFILKFLLLLRLNT